MRLSLLLLVLAGCPETPEATTVEDTYDFLAGEGTEWRWGVPTCVVYMRDTSQRTAEARWLNGGTVVKSGALSGRDTSRDFRRGYYIDSGELAIEQGEGEGAYVKRFYYDESERLTEVVQQIARGRITRTTVVYDTSNRMLERYTERDSQWPLVERWTYSAIGAADDYWSEANGRPERGYAVRRFPNNRIHTVRHWTTNRTTIYEYAYAPQPHVAIYDEGGPLARELFYEYDDKYRIVARTVAPNAGDEAGARTELVYGETDVMEQRELTANGFLRRRTVFERGTNGDVRLLEDSNADGEPDRMLDLRDECYGSITLDFAPTFSPRITIEGEPPYRPTP